MTAAGLILAALILRDAVLQLVAELRRTHDSDIRAWRDAGRPKA